MVDKGYDFEGVQRQAQTALIISAVALAILVLVLIIVCRGKFSWRYLKQKFQPAKVKTFWFTEILSRGIHHLYKAIFGWKKKTGPNFDSFILKLLPSISRIAWSSTQTTWHITTHTRRCRNLSTNSNWRYGTPIQRNDRSSLWTWGTWKPGLLRQRRVREQLRRRRSVLHLATDIQPRIRLWISRTITWVWMWHRRSSLRPATSSEEGLSASAVPPSGSYTASSVLPRQNVRPTKVSQY